MLQKSGRSYGTCELSTGGIISHPVYKSKEEALIAAVDLIKGRIDRMPVLIERGSRGYLLNRHIARRIRKRIVV
jgi:hypothetical protein